MNKNAVRSLRCLALETVGVPETQAQGSESQK